MADRIPLIVNPTASQIQELPTTDALLIHSGAGKGLEFTNNPGGGSGDVASITYEVVSGEDTKLKIGLQNDAADFIELATANGASVKVTANTASTNKTTGAMVVTGGVGISGALNVGGDITAFATSDKNLKENLVTIPNALDKVGIITGYTYKWKTAGTDYSSVDGVEDTGVIAQDVEVLGLPGITTTREDGTKAISYKRLTPLLIQAIKELKKENDDLKTLIKDSTSFQNLRSSL
tara:strand:- start:51 stop:758 length:708 start_codon:yes stop_codon:yes gene_type:complete